MSRPWGMTYEEARAHLDQHVHVRAQEDRFPDTKGKVYEVSHKAVWVQFPGRGRRERIDLKRIRPIITDATNKEQPMSSTQAPRPTSFPAPKATRVPGPSMAQAQAGAAPRSENPDYIAGMAAALKFIEDVKHDQANLKTRLIELDAATAQVVEAEKLLHETKTKQVQIQELVGALRRSLQGARTKLPSLFGLDDIEGGA